MINEYHLVPRHGTQKDFYDKALVIRENDGRLILQSYSSRVAEISADGKRLTIHDWHSKTTARHIKEFALQHGFGNVAYGQTEATKALNKYKIIWLNGEQDIIKGESFEEAFKSAGYDDNDFQQVDYYRPITATLQDYIQDVEIMTTLQANLDLYKTKITVSILGLKTEIDFNDKNYKTIINALKDIAEQS
jgi:hypothetical protein